MCGKHLIDILETPNIVLTEYDNDEEVDDNTTLFSAKSYSFESVPALKLKARVVEQSIHHKRETSNAFRHLNIVRVLHRNVKECIEAAQNGIHPSQRKRHNTDESCKATKRARVDTFIEYTKEVSSTLKCFSNLINLMGSGLEETMDSDHSCGKKC